MKKISVYILIFVVVVLSRLAFIWNSPGVDWDNWLVLYTGAEISKTGMYTASRLPGYPVAEYLASFFGTNAWWVLNVITVLFTAIGMIFFFKILNEFNFKDKFLTTIALSFVQGIFIASTSNMDYMWSICFMLAAIFYIKIKNYWLAGIALGLMIATRFTSIIFLPAILYFLFAIANERKFVEIVKVFIICFLTFGLCFVPVFSRYGLNIFPEKVEWVFIGFKPLLSFYSLYLYGVLGIFALGIAMVFCLFYFKKIKEICKEYQSIIVFNLMMIVTTTILFLRYQFESFYNLPLIPFLLILLNVCIFKTAVRRVVLVLFVLSPFLFYVSGKKVELKGSIFINEDMENQNNDYITLLHTNFQKLNDNKKICVVGGFYYMYLYNFPSNSKNQKILLRPSINELNDYKAKGFKIYYSSSAIDEIKMLNFYDISKYGTAISPPFEFNR